MTGSPGQSELGEGGGTCGMSMGEQMSMGEPAAEMGT